VSVHCDCFKILSYDLQWHKTLNLPTISYNSTCLRVKYLSAKIKCTKRLQNSNLHFSRIYKNETASYFFFNNSFVWLNYLLGIWTIKMLCQSIVTVLKYYLMTYNIKRFWSIYWYLTPIIILPCHHLCIPCNRAPVYPLSGDALSSFVGTQSFGRKNRKTIFSR
jgi:hypothetical protein